MPHCRRPPLNEFELVSIDESRWLWSNLPGFGSGGRGGAAGDSGEVEREMDGGTGVGRGSGNEGALGEMVGKPEVEVEVAGSAEAAEEETPNVAAPAARTARENDTAPDQLEEEEDERDEDDARSEEGRDAALTVSGGTTALRVEGRAEVEKETVRICAC